MLKYVQNKDVFMRYHKAHLTRRLILDTSADNEKEENMVEWLRVSSPDRMPCSEQQQWPAILSGCATVHCVMLSRFHRASGKYQQELILRTNTHVRCACTPYNQVLLC